MMIPKKDFWTISNKKYFVGDRQCSELLCRFCNVDYQNKVMRSAAIFLIDFGELFEPRKSEDLCSGCQGFGNLSSH